MFSRFFIDRPIFATVLSIVITLAGGLAISNLPLAQYPPVTPPTVQVSCTYPGASAQVVAETVAAPIEQQVNGVEKMLYMESSSANDGSYSLSVTFDQSMDLNLAQVLVQNRVNLALPMLPDVIKQTGVTTRKRVPDILMCVNIQSPHGRYDQLFLSNYALMYIRDELLRLPGIGDIFIAGQRDYSMRIWVDPDKLAARNLTAGDVVAALREQNAEVAAGQIGQQPAPPGQETQVTLTTLGRLKEPAQFADIILRATPDGRIIRIRDVGRVGLGAKNEDQSCRCNGLGSAGLIIFQLPDANALEVGDLIRAKMVELSKDFPEDFELRDSLRHHALYAAVHRRSGQGPPRRDHPGGAGGARVPAELALGDHPLDRRAGGHHRHLRRDEGDGLQPQQPHALRPGAGHRHRGRRRDRGGRGRGAPHRERAAAAGGHDQGHEPGFRAGGGRGPGAERGLRALRVHQRHHRPVLPAVRPDDRRLDDHLRLQFVDPQPGAVGHALAAAGEGATRRPGPAAVGFRRGGRLAGLAAGDAGGGRVAGGPAVPRAPTVTGLKAAAPWIAAIAGAAAGWFLGWPLNALLGRLFKLFNEAFGRATNLYLCGVGMLLRISGLVLVVYGGLLLLTYWGYMHTPKGFVPTQDMGYLMVAFQLPDAASAERTADVAERVEKICKTVPGVTNVVTYNGQSFLLSVNGSNFASMFVMLEDFEQRQTPELYGEEIANRLREKLAREVSEAKVVVVGRRRSAAWAARAGSSSWWKTGETSACGCWRNRPPTSWPRATSCRGRAIVRRWSDCPACSAPTRRRSTWT